MNESSESVSVCLLQSVTTMIDVSVTVSSRQQEDIMCSLKVTLMFPPTSRQETRMSPARV